jgi:hypothetical protein
MERQDGKGGCQVNGKGYGSQMRRIIGEPEEVVGGIDFINVNAAARPAACFCWAINGGYPVPARVRRGKVVNRIGPWFLQ